MQTIIEMRGGEPWISYSSKNINASAPLAEVLRDAVIIRQAELTASADVPQGWEEWLEVISYDGATLGIYYRYPKDEIAAAAEVCPDNPAEEYRWGVDDVYSVTQID